MITRARLQEIGPAIRFFPAILLLALLFLLQAACSRSGLAGARAADAGSTVSPPDAQPASDMAPTPPDTPLADAGPDVPTLPPDGSTPDSPSLLDASAVDAPPLLPVQYAMTSTITTVDGGYLSGSSPPPSHGFSMMVDWGAGTITSGSNGTAAQVGLRQISDTDWEAIDTIAFSLGPSIFPTISYANLKLTRGNDGCTASAGGSYEQLQGDVIYRANIRASMTNVPDMAGPVLTVVPASPVHPLAFTDVVADELLPASTTGTLAGNAASVVLTPAPSDSTIGVSAFGLRGMALAFGSLYSLKIHPSAVDLTGNPTLYFPNVSTISDPGVLTQDGFEGTVEAYMVGFAPITSADPLPIPAGDRAIAAPGGSSGGCNVRFTSRLKVKAGASNVKLTFIIYLAKSGWGIDSGYSYYFTVAVPNGSAVSTSIASLETTPLDKPWTGDPPGSDVNTYGDLLEAALPLPSDTAGEVMLDIQQLCPQPGPRPPGIVIDDVRVE